MVPGRKVGGIGERARLLSRGAGDAEGGGVYGQAEPMALYGRSSEVSVSCLELGVARCRRTVFAK